MESALEKIGRRADDQGHEYRALDRAGQHRRRRGMADAVVRGGERRRDGDAAIASVGNGRGVRGVVTRAGDFALELQRRQQREDGQDSEREPAASGHESIIPLGFLPEIQVDRSRIFRSDLVASGRHTVSDVPTAIAIPSARLDPEAHGTPCLIVLYGRPLGRRLPLDRPEVIVGRSDTAAIQVDEDWVSREHARIEVRERGCTLEDLGSTNGTWVNDARVTTTALADGDLIRVGQTVFKYLSGANIEAKFHEAMYRLTITDGLTGAVNKLAFLDALDREITRARHDRVNVSLAIFDIDFFKNVNDTWGHLAGDAVLRELSRVASGQVRPVDTFARYGGEEFALILPGMSRESARDACDAIRLLVGRTPFSHDGHALRVTISCGVATVDFGDIPASATVSPAEFIARADDRLYDAKQRGRNRVSC